MTLEEFFVKIGLDVDRGAFAVIDKLVGDVRLGMLGLGAAVAATGAALVGMATSTRDAALEASKAAQRTGLTTNAWQELKAAGESVGLSADQLETSLRLMSRTAYGAADGSKELGAVFARLGVRVKDAGGKFKEPDQLLEQLADKFSVMPDGIAKTALATRAFGRSGAELLPFLNKGSAGIQELREHAQKLGVVIDKDGIEAAKEWKRQMVEFHHVIEGLQYRIGTTLIKAFLRFKAVVTEAFARMSEGVQRFARHWQVIAAAAAGGAIYLAYAYGLAGIAAVKAGIAAVGAWLAAAAPVAAIAGLIAFVILLVDDLLTFIEGGDSLLGRFLKKVNEDNPNEPSWLRYAKEFLRVIFDLQGAWETLWKRMEDSFTTSSIGQWFASHSLGGKIASGAIKTYTPEEAAASGYTIRPSRSVTTNNAPVMNVPITIHAGPNAGPHEIAGAVVQQIDDAMQKMFREGFAGVNQ